MVGYCDFCNQFKINMRKHYELIHPKAIYKGKLEKRCEYVKREFYDDEGIWYA